MTHKYDYLIGQRVFFDGQIEELHGKHGVVTQVFDNLIQWKADDGSHWMSRQEDMAFEPKNWKPE